MDRTGTYRRTLIASAAALAATGAGAVQPQDPVTSPAQDGFWIGGDPAPAEVIADSPGDFTFEPVAVSGRLAVLENDVVCYRLTNAAAAKP